MKAAAALILLVGGFVLYNHFHGSGKSAALPGYKTSHRQPEGANPYVTDTGGMSAEELEKLLNDDTLTWAPRNPVNMQCKKQPRSHWEYVCTDAYLHATFGVNVDTGRVTSFRMLKYGGR